MNVSGACPVFSKCAAFLAIRSGLATDICTDNQSQASEETDFDLFRPRDVCESSVQA